MPVKARTSSEWFNEAARCYVEGHQACAWCGKAHQVHKKVSLGRVEYHCSFCDFQVRHDTELERFDFFPGEDVGRKNAPLTMFDFDR
jgi:hypothetical protein